MTRTHCPPPPPQKNSPSSLPLSSGGVGGEGQPIPAAACHADRRNSLLSLATAGIGWSTRPLQRVLIRDPGPALYLSVWPEAAAAGGLLLPLPQLELPTQLALERRLDVGSKGQAAHPNALCPAQDSEAGGWPSSKGDIPQRMVARRRSHHVATGEQASIRAPGPATCIESSPGGIAVGCAECLAPDGRSLARR